MREFDDEGAPPLGAPFPQVPTGREDGIVQVREMWKDLQVEVLSAWPGLRLIMRSPAFLAEVGP